MYIKGGGGNIPNFKLKDLRAQAKLGDNQYTILKHFGTKLWENYPKNSPTAFWYQNCLWSKGVSLTDQTLIIPLIHH